MTYSSIAEIEMCLADCLRYCQKHPGSVHCQRFSSRLKRVAKDFEQTGESATAQFSAWRQEDGLNKQGWKVVATLLRDVQRELKGIDAIGYPDQRVMYWDEELMEVAAREMMAYLQGAAEHIPFASDYLSRFEQAIGRAHGEVAETNQALQTFNNHIGARRRALDDATQLIIEMRSSMRRDLGKDNPEYQSIRWAWALSPDEPVL